MAIEVEVWPPADYLRQFCPKTIRSSHYLGVLIEMVELRQTPFLYLPDLAAIDPYFILPLIMGASMWFQQRLNPPPADPIQARIMQMLPIVFTVFFLWFPSGLVLYWVTNNILSIAQQVYINKKING